MSEPEHGREPHGAEPRARAAGDVAPPRAVPLAPAEAGGVAPAPAGPSPAPAAPSRPSFVAEMRALVVPFLPGAVIVIATFLVYQQSTERHVAALNALTGSEAGRVEQEMQRNLDARAAALEQLAMLRAEGGEAWRDEAAALVQRNLQIQAVVEVDSTLAVRTALPADARLLSLLAPGDDTLRAMAARVAFETPGRQAVIVTTAPLSSGERQLLVCAPVVHGGEREAWLVGVARVRDVLDHDLQGTLRRGFTAAVYEGSVRIMGADPMADDRGPRYLRDASVLRGPLWWRIDVWPGDELLDQLDTLAPVAVFVLGMLVAFGVSVAIYLWRESLARRGANDDAARAEPRGD